MKKELEHLLSTNGEVIALNSIFSLRRDLFHDDLTSRDIDLLSLRCQLPGFPSVWSERIAARDPASVIAETDAAMRRMMDQAKEQLSSRLRAGKL